MIATMAFVFGTLFKTPLQTFLPFLTVGIIFWGFITTTLTEGCNGFISAEGIIKQLPVPIFTHILRIIWRNLIILGHNLIILPVVLLAVGHPIGLSALWAIVGLFLLTINLSWCTLILAVFCTRYRDLTPIVASVIQVAFYLTPVMWMPQLMAHHKWFFLLNFNPAFHLIAVVRGPLIGTMPSAIHWIAAVLMTVIGCCTTLLVYGRYKNRIAYWL